MTDIVLGTLLEAKTRYGSDERLTELGKEMFRMYTEMGFPPDMFLDELGKRMTLDKLQMVYVVSVYQIAFLEHKRLAGATPKNIEKTRRRNREEIKRVIVTGEVGAY